MSEFIKKVGIARYMLTRCGKSKDCDICGNSIMRNVEYVATWKGGKQAGSEHFECYRRRKKEEQ